jgi:hypothetical protein
MRGVRSYQREIAKLRALVANVQWVQPSYNGGRSCSGCGEMQYHGCASCCPVAAITGDSGRPESETPK